MEFEGEPEDNEDVTDPTRAMRARGRQASEVTPCTPGGRHHARGQDAPESGRLKGVMGVQRDLRGEIAIPPGPSGPTGGALGGSVATSGARFEKSPMRTQRTPLGV